MSEIEDVARRLLGRPNANLSTRNELRFGTHGSLAVIIAGDKAGSWFDHEHGIGGGIKELRERYGERENPAPRFHNVIRYAYRDEGGALLFRVCRGQGKRFWQEQLDATGKVVRDADGKPTMRGVRLVPYHLPEIIEARRNRNGHPPRIYIVEGEKDADRLASWGVVASTNPGGASDGKSKWRDAYSPHFTGCDIVIIPDNDDTGRNHAAQVARSVARHAESVRILILKGLPDKGDISDWIEAGGDQSTLETLIDNTPLWADSPAAQSPSYVVAATRAGLDPPVRPWLVEDWIPRRQVTLIGGIGGSGKTLLALQLMIGAAHTGAWLGLPVMRCKSFGLFAEDEDDEIDLRLRDNANLADLADLAWRSGVTQECELVETGPDGALKSTPAFDQLRQDVLDFAARLVVLDAAADLFGGDEIRRRQVAVFIRLLRRLAIEIDGAVVLLAHPSNHGIANNTGLSGSTGWGNSSRSVLVFGKSTDDGADDDERVLRREKANYAKRGEIIRMRWTRGSFTPLDPPGSLDSILMHAKADRVFLDLLVQTYQAGAWSSANSSARNYAPRIFAQHPDREGLGKPAFEAAMLRLQRAGRIKTETYGRPSEPRQRLVCT